MPALPKHSSTRARRNRVAGARTLTIAHDVETPELPELPDWEWHPMTVRWWEDVWRSPMAPEYDPSDVHGLYRLAVLVDQFWGQPSPATAGEIRLQSQLYGLTPLDRRRLQWEIDRGDEAAQRTQQRSNERTVRAAAADGPPPPSATKAQWVAWIHAVHRVGLGDLEALKKPELIARYGPDATVREVDARDALA
jgi:hypothetical protein